MINLGIRTEFSFRNCFLPIKDIHKYATNNIIAVADDDNTFSHIPLEKECKKHGIKPIFGVRMNVCSKDQRKCDLKWIFFAKNEKGLQELYELVTLYWKQFYYIPKLYPNQIGNISENIIVISPMSKKLVKNQYGELVARRPDYRGTYIGDYECFYEDDYPLVFIQNNNYGKKEDRKIYQLLAGCHKRGDDKHYNFESRTGPQHIISEDELKNFPIPQEAIENTYKIAEICNVNIPKGSLVKIDTDKNLMDLCLEGAVKRNIDLDSEPYKSRFRKEMDLIIEKGFEDYFLIVSDMVNYAKKHMLVGPSRGSSAGSLVCYLIGITEIDPLKYDLVFERFIDVNRHDLPDIDVDFPDTQRDMVVAYLASKYGENNVMTLANINRLKPKSAIGEFASGLGIPKYETDDVKNAIIERSGGDARASMCILDTFETTEQGRQFIKKYPKMKVVEAVEAHASHAGKHAAGVIVSNEKLTKFGAINSRDEIVMMDKHGAEYLGLLKIDCLGLRTLSILQECAKMLGMSYDDIYNIPLDDQKVFDLINSMRLTGIFQFEGYALYAVTKQVGVHSFNDIVAITALARPGALNSGGTAKYIKRKLGQEPIKYINDIHKSIVEETYGVTIYQEQMMNIARNIGNLSWKDVSDLRRAASKSLGDEFFGKYKDKFLDGAINKSGLSKEEAEEIWNDICHSGSWLFNKSHAVSYGLISYWTAWFKANYPLEFAVATLRHSKSKESTIKFLRDFVEHEGYEYVPVDPEISEIDWSVKNGKLVGGLINIDGIGYKKAELIVKCRNEGKMLSPGLAKLLQNPKTPYDILFPAKHYWGFLYDSGQFSYIKDVNSKGTYTILGVLVDRNLRDLNEHVFLKERGGQIIENDKYYLNFKIEDDTDSILCKIGRFDFERLNARKISENGVIGKTWIAVHGVLKSDWRKIDVLDYVILNEKYPGVVEDE